MRIKILSLFLVFAIIFSALTGCISNTSTPNGITFTDALNREVRIDNPKRVCALIGSFAEVWMLAGGELVGAPEDAWSDFNLNIPNGINIGGAHSPSLELILSASPDFVIASASTASNVSMKDTLTQAGITVAYFDVDNFEDYLNMLDILTDITGRKDLYTKNGLAIKAQIDAIKANIQNSSLTDRERTVLLLRAHSGSVKAKGSTGTILGEMLCDIGCINIADSNTSLLESLSIESIIIQNPYRIFVVTMGDDTQKAIDNLNSMINENPGWRSLDAITQGRLHIMDRRLFNIKPNVRWAQAYEKLSEIFLSR